jgi:hypothetical protein
MSITGQSNGASAWIKCSEQLPPVKCEVVAWLVGFKDHSGLTWKREGRAFMVRWDNAPKETGVDGWADRFMAAAREKLDAHSLQVTHWMLCDKPGDLE